VVDRITPEGSVSDMLVRRSPAESKAASDHITPMATVLCIVAVK
jgi:hypothetical protein